MRKLVRVTSGPAVQGHAADAFRGPVWIAAEQRIVVWCAEKADDA